MAEDSNSNGAQEPEERMIGQEIKRRRQAKGWTLDDLSQRSGVSIAAISKIEKGQSNPSFDTILRITRPLQVNFVEMMEGPATTAPTARLISTLAGEAELHQTDHYDYEVHSASLKHKVMVPLKMRIHGRTPPPREEWSIHDGEEFIYVLKGVLVFHTEHYAPLTLKEGESCYLDSTMPHAFASGTDGPAEVLSICLSIQPFESKRGG
ncbi:helix-turn-helix domain-containing protein [Methyloligella solikamskensis]|uniref:Helix-turn-helix domain-containing protein n=1 Tax=Methyloligella solikamskensis TaxID=1177756 RepID=A0ABW3J998_9HYPH